MNIKISFLFLIKIFNRKNKIISYQNVQFKKSNHRQNVGESSSSLNLDFNFQRIVIKWSF